MKSIIVEDSSVEEAVQSALKKLEAKREQVEVDILEEGSKGFLGFIGSKRAKVKVTFKETHEELIRNFIDEVIGAMELNVDYDIFLENEYWCVEFTGEDVRFLIGRRGKTLNALQMLTNLAVNKKLEDRIRIIIDAEDYRKRREETLRGLARKTAERVCRTKGEVILEPMTPQERRIIHLELQDHDRVVTLSRGEEPYRKVVVRYKLKGV